MTDDPRIGAAVEVVSREIHVRDWHKGHARRGCALCLGLATRVIQAADAVDPLRVSLPPNPRQTRAGIAPAGTPTKRIWPEP